MNILIRQQITPPSFPARPMNGGRFDLAPPKRGVWFYEPKYNGWRATVHAPTGSMFNRHNERLTIEQEFAEALEKIKLNADVSEWFDVEGLDRRHGICRGSLIILDTMIPGLVYEERRTLLAGSTGEQPFYQSKMQHCRTYLHTNIPDERGALFLWESYRGESEAPGLWEALKEANRHLGAEFYEGMVAKRADSLYPLQLRNSKQETPHWIKHRWEF